MAKPPGLESLDQAAEFNSGCAHLPLVVLEPVRTVIGDRIVVLAYVSEHAQESFELGGAAFAKGSVLRRCKQRRKQAAILLDEMIAEITFRQTFQLPQKIRWQAAPGQGIAQRLQFMRSDPL